MKNLLLIVICIITFSACGQQLRDNYSSLEAISFIAAGIADTVSKVPVIDEYNNITYMNVIIIDDVPYYPAMSNGAGLRYFKADKYHDR